MGDQLGPHGRFDSYKFDWERYLHRRTDFKLVTKGIAFGLAHYADKYGCNMWPGNKRLARELSVCEKTIERHLELLRDAGLITRVSDHKDHAWRSLADEYRLDLPPDFDVVPGLLTIDKTEVRDSRPG